MRFEKGALRILNGGPPENEVMILMDVRSRCYGVIDFGVAQVALSGFRPSMCSSCCLPMASTDYSTLLCAVGLVSQDPPQPMSTFPDFRSSL